MPNLIEVVVFTLLMLNPQTGEWEVQMTEQMVNWEECGIAVRYMEMLEPDNFQGHCTLYLKETT